MVTVPHIMVGLERMLDYRGVVLERYSGVWISQTSGDTEIQCSLDKSDLWGH